MQIRVVAANPGISPNGNGLPGIDEAKRIVGALLTFGIIAAVAGLAIAAIAWALGSHSSNPHLAGRGKVGVIVAAASALLIGGADVIIGFFQSAGQSI
jgi:hypothetical protein